MSTNEPRIALITGASKRLGRATASLLHANNYNVVIHYNNSAKEAEDFCAELNANRNNSAITLQADLAETGKLVPLVEQAARQWGQFDLLVNNASTFYPAEVESTTEEQWEDLMASNAKAPFFLSQAACSHLRKTSGSIVNMIDIHAESPLASHTVYCMAKAALSMMTRSLAAELAPSIRVNGVSPGAILWPENDPDMSEATKQGILDGIPLARIGNEQDIAETVLFLANASYITGQILAVDGGRSLNQVKSSEN